MAVSQPYERRAERIAELRKAYGLLEHAAAEDREASRWFAQIATSLAKELGKGTADERSEAKRLFECRLQLDAQRQLDDLRGTAMAVAGLGRLEWYAEPKNVAAAEKHFQRNLEISEAIGDIIAQVKMHSLLGACAWKKTISNRPWLIISGHGNWPAIRSTGASLPLVCSGVTNDRIAPINSRAWRNNFWACCKARKSLSTARANCRRCSKPAP